MNKQLLPFLFSAFFILLSFAGCIRSLTDNQLQFGIQAAQNDLWDEAIFRWKKVLLSNPRSSAAHNNLAVAYEKKGLWEEAKKEYEVALKIDPNNSYIKKNYQSFEARYDLQKKEEKDEKK